MPLPSVIAEGVDEHADGLCRYIDASPTPYHAVAQAAAMLAEAGFDEVDEVDPWPREPGRYYVRRAGTIAAWSTAALSSGGSGGSGGAGHAAGFRILGGHTDSRTYGSNRTPTCAPSAGTSSASRSTAAR